MKKEEATYWITLAHLPGWSQYKINDVIIKFFHEHKISIEEFFQLNEHDWLDKYQLDEKQISDLKKARSELASNAFLAESLFSQGYEIIPITSNEYSNALKKNLKAAYSPSLIYLKGNKKILDDSSIVVVGQEDMTKTDVQFTDNVVKMAAERSKVVISSYARGVDKYALNSSLKHNGRSIIVLAQGITTFASGYTEYYKQIMNGDILVLSSALPKAPWNSKYELIRDRIALGLAEEVYVTALSKTDSSWKNVIDGIGKGRKIYVRKPGSGEVNSNNVLIEKGGIAVDVNGNVLAD